MSESTFSNMSLHSQIVSAVASGNRDLLITIATSGVDPNYVLDERGSPLIHIACKLGHLNIVRTLVEVYHCNPDTINPVGATPWHIACENGHISILRYLLNVTHTQFEIAFTCVDANGQNLLYKACYSGCVIMVRFVYGVAITKRMLKACWYYDNARITELITKTQSSIPYDTDISAALLVAIRNNHKDILRVLFEEFYPYFGSQIKHNGPHLLLTASKLGLTDLVIYLTRICGIKPTESAYGSQLETCVLQVARSSAHIGTQKKEMFSNSDSALHAAARCGNIELIKMFLDSLNLTNNPHAVNEQGDSVLHAACISGNLMLVQYLVENCQLDIDAKNNSSDTPLHLASSWGFLPLVKYLAGRGCNINAVNCRGNSPLHLALMFNHLEVSNFLLGSMNCDINVQTNDGETALHIACSMNPDVIHDLLKNANLKSQNVSDKYGDTPLFNACRIKNIEVVKVMIESGCDPLFVNGITKETPVHVACRTQQLKVVEILLSKHSGEFPNLNNFGESLLHIACMNEDIAMVHYIIDKHRCSPSIKDSNEKTPLHYSCTRNDTEISRLLLANCLRDGVDSSGDTPLHNVFHAGFVNPELVIMLLDSDFNILRSQNKQGFTPLHNLCLFQHCNILQLLIRTVPDNKLREACSLTTIKGDTLIHMAAKANAKDVIKLLKDKNFVNPKQLNDELDTALHIACELGCEEAAIYLCAIGCDPVQMNIEGMTPVAYAICNQHYKLSLLLTKHYQPQNAVVRSPIGELKNSRDRIFKLRSQRNSQITRAIFNHYFDHLPRRDYNIYKLDPNDTIEIPVLHLMLILTQMYEYDGSSILRMIQKNEFFIQNVSDSYGNTIFHLLPYWEIDNSIREFVLAMFLKGEHPNVNQRDKIGGNTSLHIACRSDNYSLAKILLNSHADFALSLREKNSYGKTPLHYVQDRYVINYFISLGADPRDAYDSELVKEILNSSNKHPLKPTVGVIVVGNSSVGKTTLIAAIKSDSEVIADSSLVDNVDGPTAGVVETVIESEYMGRIKFFDFAGQPQFESSHSALLNSLAEVSASFNSPPLLFVVVINICLDAIMKQLQRWLSFIMECPSRIQRHVLILCSHSDCLHSDRSKKLQLIKREMDSHSTDPDCISFVSDPILLDCRRIGTSELKQLKMILKENSSKLEKCTELDNRCHILFAKLLEWFQDSPVRVRQLLKKVRQMNEFVCEVALPESVNILVELLENLHTRQHILLFKHGQDTCNYWILTSTAQRQLFEEVNGVLFAPDNFKKQLVSKSNVGILPFSIIKQCFPERKSDIIEEFLVYSEFCEKIKDKETLNLIQGVTQPPSHDCTPTDDYYFFPGLIMSGRPDGVWNLQESACYSYSCGWCLQCTQKKVFPSRFMHVLLLRVTFTFALAMSNKSSEIPLMRKCALWKNGIKWSTTSGVEVLVEFLDEMSVLLVLIRCLKGQELESVRIRSSVLKKIWETKHDISPRVNVNEFVVNSPDLCTSYPSIEEKSKVNVIDVAQSVVENSPCVLDCNFRPISLDTLLYFEPYSHLGKEHSKDLFSNEKANEEIPSTTLLDMSKSLHSVCKHIITVLQIPIIELGYQKEQLDNPVMYLHHIFELWREREMPASFQVLRSKLNEFSIFFGRNPQVGNIEYVKLFMLCVQLQLYCITVVMNCCTFFLSLLPKRYCSTGRVLDMINTRHWLLSVCSYTTSCSYNLWQQRNMCLTIKETC